MAKPIPNHIRYGLDNGWISLDNNQLALGGSNCDEHQFVTVTGQEDEVAGVLLALAQVLLNRLEPEVSNNVLKEAGLKEVSLGAESLEQAPQRNVNERNVMNERNEPGRQSKFEDRTEQTLLSSGLSLDEVRYLAAFSGIRNAIANSSNPAASARTILSREKHQKALPVWLKKNPAPKAEATPDKADSDSGSGRIGQLCDDCGEFDSNCKCGPPPKSKAFEIDD